MTKDEWIDRCSVAYDMGLTSQDLTIQTKYLKKEWRKNERGKHVSNHRTYLGYLGSHSQSIHDYKNVRHVFGYAEWDLPNRITYQHGGEEMIYPSAVLSFITGPIRVEKSGSRTILTHIQKYSHFGFMVTWPWCLHFWIFWRLQKGNDNQGWEPGTEQGIYMRTPGKRWDAEEGMRFTKGYAGLRWD